MRRPLLALVSLAALAGCGGGVDATGATASESQQLNDAAQMLDANSVDASAVDPDQPGEDQQ
jgi:ABC-type glycerol-3-phosphate transport system substrate-binding protein